MKNYPLKLFILIASVLLSTLTWGQNPPRTYTAYKTETPIKIDGKANEMDWSKVDWSEKFIDIEGVKTPKYETRFKMLWDEEFMYYYVEMEEPHVWGNLCQRDTVIFYNNDFEIFWDPNGDTHEYYEFEINALNTIWDLFLTKPYREKNAAMDSWDIRGAKSAVVVNGTLNNPSDTDKGWQLEIAIPWAAFRTSFGQNNVPVNQFWRINFSRVNWDFDVNNGIYDRKKDENGNYLREYNWVWSPQGVINMHEPEKWGYIFFSDKKAGEKVEFEIPEEEKIRWHLFGLYRQVKSAKQPIQCTSELENPVLNYKGQNLVPVLEHHHSGWNIFIPTTEKIYLIREDGKYTTIKINKQ